MIDFGQLEQSIMSKAMQVYKEKTAQYVERLNQFLQHEIAVNISVFANHKFADQMDGRFFYVEWNGDSAQISISLDNMVDWAKEYMQDIVWPNLRQEVSFQGGG